MSSDSKVKTVTINKMGVEAPPPAPPTIDVPVLTPMGGKKTKTFPKGILRKTKRVLPKPVQDPAKPPEVRKKTLRMLTGKGYKKLKHTIKHKVKKLDDKTIRRKLVEKKLIKADSKASPDLLRKMYEEGMGAGLLKV